MTLVTRSAQRIASRRLASAKNARVNAAFFTTAAKVAVPAFQAQARPQVAAKEGK
jgi:hypothetical protein